MMRDIQASAQVRALIGAQTLQRLHTDAYQPYVCAACGRPGTTTEPTTVTAERGPSAVRVTLNHAACAKSSVRYVHADRPPAGITRMRSLPAILDFGTPPHLRALLILEPAIELSALLPGGRHLDPAIVRLLAYGLTLLHNPGQMPKPAPGWRLRLALGRATLRAPDHTVAYRGTCHLPSGWRAVAAKAGGPVLIIGTIGLPVGSDPPLTPERLHALIHAATARRDLLAAQITHGADITRRQS